MHPRIVTVLQRAAKAKNARLTGEIKWRSDEVSHAAISNAWWCAGCQREHKSNNVIVGYSILAGLAYEYCHVAKCKSKLEEVEIPAAEQRQIRQWYDKLPPVTKPDELVTSATKSGDSTVATAANWKDKAMRADATADPDDLTATNVIAYGPVQLDMTREDFIGCIDRTNNTGELSAVPHAIYRVYRWRQKSKRQLNLRPQDKIHVIMVYDSMCARINCEAKEADPLPDRNTTVVRMIRRLITEVSKYHIRIHWVKVRGHSNQEGNDKADKAATWGQNGGGKNVENMVECMEWLEASTRIAQEDAKATKKKDPSVGRG